MLSHLKDKITIFKNILTQFLHGAYSLQFTEKMERKVIFSWNRDLLKWNLLVITLN